MRARESPGQGTGAINNGVSTTAEDTAYPLVLVPPQYGTEEFHELPDGHPARQAAILHAAECWRVLASNPHVSELIAEIIEWDRRRDMSASTASMASLRDWARLAGAPTYAELERRRHVHATPARTPAQIRAAADYSWRRIEQQNGRAAA
jgi:hypothetical protein